jgi:hypothetical protein
MTDAIPSPQTTDDGKSDETDEIDDDTDGEAEGETTDETGDGDTGATTTDVCTVCEFILGNSKSL